MKPEMIQLTLAEEEGVPIYILVANLVAFHGWTKSYHNKNTVVRTSDGNNWDVLQTPEQIIESLSLEKIAPKKKRASKRKAKR